MNHLTQMKQMKKRTRLLNIFILVATILVISNACEKKEKTPDPVLKSCVLTKKAKYNNNDIFVEGVIYEYDAQGKVSKFFELGGSEEIKYYEIYQYGPNPLDSNMSILLSGSRYNQIGGLISTLFYNHSTIFGQVLVVGKTAMRNDSTMLFKETYGYNTNGQKVKTSYYLQGAEGDSLIYDSTYNYNSNGLIASYTYYNYPEDVGDGMIYEYDFEDNVTREIFLDKNGNTINEYRYKNEYGPGYKLIKQEKLGEAEFVISYKVFEYNDYTNTVKITHFSGNSDLKAQQTLSYNKLGYLLEDKYFTNADQSTTTWKYTYNCVYE